MYDTGGRDFWLLACWVERVSSEVTPRVTRAGTASGCTRTKPNLYLYLNTPSRGRSEIYLEVTVSCCIQTANLYLCFKNIKPQQRYELLAHRILPKGYPSR